MSGLANKGAATFHFSLASKMTIGDKLMAAEPLFETKIQVDIVCIGSQLSRQLLYSLFGDRCCDKTVDFSQQHGICTSGWDTVNDTIVTSSMPIDFFVRFETATDELRLGEFVIGVLPDAIDALRLRIYAAAGRDQALVQLLVIENAMEQPIGICGTACRAATLSLQNTDDALALFEQRGTHLTIEPSLCINTLQAAFALLADGETRRRQTVSLQLKARNAKLFIHVGHLSAIRVGNVKVHQGGMPALELGSEQVENIVDIMTLSGATLSLCWSPTLQILCTKSSTGWRYERLTPFK